MSIDRPVCGALFSKKYVRDYKIDCATQTNFPFKFELKMPKVKDQGKINSCVACSIATVIEYYNAKQLDHNEDMSIGYIYGNRRATDYQGEGMYVRQALKNFNHDGDCLNVDFPYRGSYPKMKAKIAEKPEEYKEKASKSKLVNYFRLYSEEEVKRALISHGAVVVGITIYSSFGTHAKVPTKEDKESGGHAMCCVG